MLTLLSVVILLGTATFLIKSNIFRNYSPKTSFETKDSFEKENVNVDPTQIYTSKDLKISFAYPENWYVDEKDYDIMITSYQTVIGENKSPNPNEIKIFIDNFNGCHKTIEENLIDPACGEGGTKVEKNKILSKEMRQANDGTFYKYKVQTPNTQFTYYLLQKSDKVLQIEKHPDPSQFEKEFEQIVNAIKFL